MRRVFDQWVSELDMERAVATTTVRTWSVVGLAAAVVIALTGVVPVTRELFLVDARAAALAFVPVVAVAVFIAPRPTRFAPRFFGVIVLFGMLAFQFFMLALVALAGNVMGAALLAVLPVLLMAWYGYVWLSTPRYPFVALTGVTAHAGALLLRHDAAAIAIFSLTAAAGILSGLVLGLSALSENRARRRLQSVQQAFWSQQLTERTADVERMSMKMLRILSHQHDAGSSLSAAILRTELLLGEARYRDDSLLALLDALKALQAVLREAREEAQVDALPMDRVDAKAALEKSVASARMRYPGRRIDLHIEADLPQPLLCGGALALERIVQNLVDNAAQGRLARGAQSIIVGLCRADAPFVLSLTVDDDGPGFATPLPSLSPFSTDKQEGSGLGLFTVSRLVAANAAKLELGRSSLGGAAVTILLSRA